LVCLKDQLEKAKGKGKGAGADVADQAANITTILTRFVSVPLAASRWCTSPETPAGKGNALHVGEKW
jgi:hypothetical protein